MRLLSLFPWFLLSLLLSQCSMRTMAIREVASLASDGIPAFERDDDPELIKEAIPGQIKLMETMLESDPENVELLTLLSQLYASYTFGFIEPQLDSPDAPAKAAIKERVNRLFLRGIAYGERALASAAPSCKKGLANASELDSCLAKLDRSEVPALFWYGFNLAAYINRNLNSVSALAQGVNVEKSMARVIALNEGYTFGCAHVLLMAFFGSRSPMMGGNPEKAEAHYQRARELNQNEFLLADVFYARYVLVQKDDKAAFEKTLQGVVEKAGTQAKNPRLQLYNSLAKNRAAQYLTTTDEYF